MIDYKRELLALQNSHEENEVRVECKKGVFRVDLTPENLRLWNETILSFQKPCNLLLACDSDKVNLRSSHLPWVVGSAIRPAQVKTPDEACDLLECLGVDNELASIAKDRCPGLGKIDWAFYFDRHHSLTASPAVILLEEK